MTNGGQHNPFDWEERLQEAYGTPPAAADKPIIGITMDYADGRATLAEGYYKSVARAGGVPVAVPPLADTAAVTATLRALDGLVLSGGGDINPLYAGEQPLRELRRVNGERDLPELLTARLACNMQLPVLAICRGIQTLVMALGGRVAQDIYADCDVKPSRDVKHEQDAGRDVPTHTVTVRGGSALAAIYPHAGTLHVNSFHHQAVARTGGRLVVCASAADGVTEAVESAEHKPVIGVQWHPECLSDGAPLFRWLAGQAALFRQAKALHRSILSIDSHCDTPMLFPQGVDFCRRDSRALVDLHKMREGMLDAVVMAAYIPQPPAGEPFASKTSPAITSPKDYAAAVFDRIEDMTGRNDSAVRIARAPQDIAANKRAGRLSVLLAIENALALEGDVRNVDTFAQRGVVYITLCHNGDNDVCDSAKGAGTHGGVSPFGEQVIRRMNARGVMVDLSHASQKSFYDAINISAAPVICSHSSARSLCNHPRNLTDEQMTALARRGGVAQTTLYKGFLNSAGEADVRDVIAHLNHAVSVMGIDHVGIGTDFDGGGGVPGFADASEAVRFTCRLLAERYGADDIELIWGGNFLRVMDNVQARRTTPADDSHGRQ